MMATEASTIPWVSPESLAARRRVEKVERPPIVPVPPVSNLRIAVVMLLVAETMLFAGLIGAYLVFRVGSAVWPPVDLPRLPLGITWVNTFVLMISGFSMWGALRSCNRGDGVLSRRNLTITVALGAAFVAIQGSEWARLVHHGLTLSAGSYGSTFYLLIGAHAVHVTVGLLWLGFAWFRLGVNRAGKAREPIGAALAAQGNSYRAGKAREPIGAALAAHGGSSLNDARDVVEQSGMVEAAAIYWFFVCALWLVLFGLVY